MTMKITFVTLILVLSVIWLLVRVCIRCKNKRVDWRREGQLFVVYLCTVVVVRLTFFPFSRVDGQIQPLMFDAAQMLAPRINVLPFVYLFDYPTTGEILLNVIGNSVLFLPYGIVFPIVFRALNSPQKVIAAGVGTSLCIEILQLPFYDRVSDIDDLILNTLGYLIGYGIYCLIKRCRNKKQTTMI